ncbi:MAG: GatB/YqeY domain-containing protein [Acidimicrobiia bacterium]
MTIREELGVELHDAIKTGDKLRRDAIRQVETEVSTAKSRPDFSGDIDDELYQTVISSYVKKMDKSRAEYEDIGERGKAMAEKLRFEVEYLSRWLPRKLDEQQTRALVREAIAELDVAGDEKAIGRVMGHLMQNRGQDLDGSLVNQVAREELTGG